MNRLRKRAGSGATGGGESVTTFAAKLTGSGAVGSSCAEVIVPVTRSAATHGATQDALIHPRRGQLPEFGNAESIRQR